MRQSTAVSSVLTPFSCPSCHFTTHFCPCCGKYLTGSASADATNRQYLHNTDKSRRSQHAHPIIASNSSHFFPLLTNGKTVRQTGDKVNVSESFVDPAGAFFNADQNVIEWAQRQLQLPRRPLSAFEVFCHESSCGVDEHIDRGAARPSAQVDACSSNGGIIKRVDLNPGEEDILHQRRILAQKWFYADRQLREECEKRAKVWSDIWTNPTHASVITAAAVGADTAMPSSQHSSGSAAQHLPSACCSLPSDPLVAKSSGEGSAEAQVSVKKRSTKLNVCVSSYQLFRTANKGKFSSQVAAGQAWRALSPNSKAPFDEAAATLRVQRLLQADGGALKE